MNAAAMPAARIRHLAAGLALALLAACGSPGEAPLAGSPIGGPFELVDKQGKTVKWSDFDGRYRIVYFGYAYCPDVCPYDVQRMIQGYNLFKREHAALAKDVTPIFITIDPARDTPAKVGEFTAAFSPELMGLTGSEAQVDGAARAFKVFYAKGEDAGGDSYLMDHSRAAYLMGREGQPIALLPVERADKGEAVAAELAKWVH